MQNYQHYDKRLLDRLLFAIHTIIILRLMYFHSLFSNTCNYLVSWFKIWSWSKCAKLIRCYPKWALLSQNVPRFQIT